MCWLRLPWYNAKKCALGHWWANVSTELSKHAVFLLGHYARPSGEGQFRALSCITASRHPQCWMISLVLGKVFTFSRTLWPIQVFSKQFLSSEKTQFLKFSTEKRLSEEKFHSWYKVGSSAGCSVMTRGVGGQGWEGAQEGGVMCTLSGLMLLCSRNQRCRAIILQSTIHLKERLKECHS